jgi:4-amino-4-deoxy-L-arabinose transferase-like glycosyltransferase
MQYFSGREILAGVGYISWTSHFWPPLFSFLIGIGSLVMPGFLAGKLISILSSSILLYIAYQLAVELTDRNEVGLWTQVFVALSPIYFYESLQAHNHMLDALLFITGLWLFARSSREPKSWKLLLAGIVCGIAGLARFTSYILFVLPVILYLTQIKYTKSTKLAVAFWTGFVAISLL